MTLELNGFFIDVVVPVIDDDGESTGQIQMVRNSVLAAGPEDAVKRFIEDEAGVEVERTEPTDLIVVGLSPAGPPGMG
jgi:hypothetical protein